MLIQDEATSFGHLPAERVTDDLRGDGQQATPEMAMCPTFSGAVETSNPRPRSLA